jgi:N6-adenosine-specific RNA methylase IME4
VTPNADYGAPFAGLSPPYATIVADPPWPYDDGCVALGPGHGVLRANQPLPYSSMTLVAIAALPVQSIAADDARLFLWTTNRHLPGAFEVVDAWGFTYKQTLVWHKRDVNLVGSVAPNSAEFVLVATRGEPQRLLPLPSAVLSTVRRGGHSTKPAAMSDYIEQVSPGPYVELFARAPRLGWDHWGYGYERVSPNDG